MSYMNVHQYWLKIVTEQAKIITKNLKKVHSNLPATVSVKLWHLDVWIYQVISSVKVALGR